jgi:hypothetical protein
MVSSLAEGSTTPRDSVAFSAFVTSAAERPEYVAVQALVAGPS